ncbi:cupin domain-containing protein [Mangrovimicrobium sediminis]|uniref:Cupin domain-containing protein n=1 Tax=Mangrovimicrobium sediminis TaxID=2562682 RepID=A0A4Z0LX03_9GAMM|nr:cupin domain-containing protein [Haliea sp. SAOS-164]TGD71770.1 cupin domain-containing protein [Haliea sp. SAOS-164]
MRMLITLVLLAASAVCGAATEELLRSGQTWEGMPLTYPPGQAEITSVRLTLEPGQLSTFHCHPVPTFGYILAGRLEVETIDGAKIVFEPGTSTVEVMRTVHRGRALDGPVEVIVFYAGAEGVPTTVLPEKDPEHRYCNAPQTARD